MYCSLITFLCVVGGVQVGPEIYKIDVYNQMDKAFYEVYVPVLHKDQVVSLIKFWHNFVRGLRHSQEGKSTPRGGLKARWMYKPTHMTRFWHLNGT